jgi:germination protein M
MVRFDRRYGALALVLTVLLFLFAACGGDDTDPDVSSSPTSDASTPGATPTEDETPTTGTIELEVWFTQDADLFMSHREVPDTEAVGRAAVEALLDGPNELESEFDVVSVIPDGTELLDLSVADGVATVDLSGEYESGGGSASMFARLSQVVYTLTQFPTVDGVEFRIDGKLVDTFSGEGIALDGPQERKDYEDQLPSILVEVPGVGARISSPMTVSGTANVFEATVSIRLVGSNGEVLRETFTTATCGTGCRGDYEAKVRFDVSEPTEAVLEVYESSAEDGSATHVERIPVVLLPD